MLEVNRKNEGVTHTYYGTQGPGTPTPTQAHKGVESDRLNINPNPGAHKTPRPGTTGPPARRPTPPGALLNATLIVRSTRTPSNPRPSTGSRTVTPRSKRSRSGSSPLPRFARGAPRWPGGTCIEKRPITEPAHQSGPIRAGRGHLGNARGTNNTNTAVRGSTRSKYVGNCIQIHFFYLWTTVVLINIIMIK